MALRRVAPTARLLFGRNLPAVRRGFAAGFTADADLWARTQELARKPQTSVSMNALVRSGSGQLLDRFQLVEESPTDKESLVLVQMAQFLHRELPVRLSHRIHQLDSIGHGPRQTWPARPSQPRPPAPAARAPPRGPHLTRGARRQGSRTRRTSRPSKIGTWRAVPRYLPRHSPRQPLMRVRGAAGARWGRAALCPVACAPLSTVRCLTARAPTSPLPTSSSSSCSLGSALRGIAEEDPPAAFANAGARGQGPLPTQGAATRLGRRHQLSHVQGRPPVRGSERGG